MRTWRAVIAALAAGALVGLALMLPGAPATATSTLPPRLTDAEFWRLSSSFSEDGGSFHSDNFVSNERHFQAVIPDLLRRARPNGVYIGVGPEQNFTYIAALKPAMAFIVDIRRGNLHQHLLYKTLFELSGNRAEFLARLFARDVPQGSGDRATAGELFAALDAMPALESRYRENLRAVTERLTVHHRFPLAQADLDGIAYVYRAGFFAGGPDLSYRLTRGGGLSGGGTPTYADLMTADDGSGRQRAYLAEEEAFQAVKAMQVRNLIVPVVGDFGGPTALRAVGQFARAHGAVVSALYASNVEQYLRGDGKWAAFCANVAAMPLDETSTFIRSERGGRELSGSRAFVRFRSTLGAMQAETRTCDGPEPGRMGR